MIDRGIGRRSCRRGATCVQHGGAPLGKESPHCAFCFLAKAYTEAPDTFEHPFWHEVADAPYVRDAGHYHW